jgi:hypothetical protein
MMGRISQILVKDKSGHGLLIVEEFELGEALHPTLGMPVLKPRGMNVLLQSQVRGSVFSFSAVALSLSV